MKTKIFLIPLLIILTSLFTYLALPPQIPLSPISSTAPSLENWDTGKPEYLILGFAPYWNLKKLSPESSSGITHFAYFALHLNQDGNIYTHVNKREQDPGFTNYQRLLAHSVSIPNKPLILTFMPINQDALNNILSSTAARRNAITSILTSLNESGATGVNIDFEPVGDISPTLRDNFTLFIKELANNLQPNNYNLKPLLTISIYPSAAVKPRIWDLSSLAPLTDYFVVMTYDYTMPKASAAGPNSPLRDLENSFEHNVIKNIAEITNLVPSEKILLGIPLYGYEWDTVDNSKYAPTNSRGSTASLERIEKMLNEKTLELVWDRNSLTPYGTSTESGITSQIYFENATSLRLKLEFVKNSHLGGIALWALGYDNNVPWLWPTLATLNQE